MTERSGKIVSISPKYAIPGGEVEIVCEGIRPHPELGYRCYFNGTQARLTGASPERMLAVVPDGLSSADVDVQLEGADGSTEPAKMTVGGVFAEDLHIVANPAVDPRDGSVIVTRSGSRGQKLPVTLFRVKGAGLTEEIPADFLNPTGIAFSASGKLFVTNRAEGEVCEVTSVGEVVPHCTGLGVATGIAFDEAGVMHVGDRGGTIYTVGDFGVSEVFATLEPSVAAYHMAFGPDGGLYVTAPGLSSHDVVYAIDRAGFERRFFKGLGRPQGLAFDRAGNLYVAACYKGGRGVVKISDDGDSAELFVAGKNVVGLCFGKEGELYVATNDTLFAVPVGIQGSLLRD